MGQRKIFLLSVAGMLVLTGFTWPGEKTEKSSKTPAAAQKAEAAQEAPVSHGSDLMEGTVAALDLEGKPVTVTLQFTSGQKTAVEIVKDTTVFSKGETLGTSALAVGGRVRVEYVTAGQVKTAKNIEIVEVTPPPAAAKADASAKKEPSKKSASVESKPAAAVSSGSVKTDEKIDE